MAYVYEATHRPTGRSSALKVMDPGLPEPELALGRFLREAEQLTRIRHRHVVQATTRGFVGELPYLEIELLDGLTLEERLIRGPQPTVEEAVGILLPVLAGMQTCHDLGIVHRDLKPDNVILEPDGDRFRPVIVDFGMAKSLADELELTTPNAILGTLFYMAPEQARGHRCGPASDQYSVAAILFEMLAGRRLRKRAPVSTLVHKAREGHVPDLEVASDLEAVIRRALSVDPADRFSSCRRFALALLPFASDADAKRWNEALPASIDSPFANDDPLDPTETTMSFRTDPSAVRGRLLGGALAAVTVAGVVASVLVAQRGTPSPSAMAPGHAAAFVPADTVSFEVDVDQPEARIFLDGALLSRGSYRGKLNREPRTFQLRIEHEGFAPVTRAIRADGDVRLNVSLVAAPR